MEKSKMGLLEKEIKVLDLSLEDLQSIDKKMEKLGARKPKLKQDQVNEPNSPNPLKK